MKKLTFAADMKDNRISEERRFAVYGRRIGKVLKARGLTMSTAESCTGGTIASMVTQIAGSSAWFRGAVVSYATDVKEDLLGVKLIDNVVSENTARQMAEGVAKLLNTDCAVSSTGVAGPKGGTRRIPKGTVCLGVYFKGISYSKCCRFEGNREAVVLQAADAALAFLIEIILSNN